MLFCNGFSGELFKFEANIIGRSNDDGDGNENGKKAIGLDWQNNNFARASRFFCTFLSRCCTTTTWKCLISRFVEDVNEDNKFLFLFLNFDTVL